MDQNESPPRQLKRVGYVAKLLNVSDRQVHKMAADRLMPPPLRLGGAIRWDEQVLEEWIRNGCQPLGKSSVANNDEVNQ